MSNCTCDYHQEQNKKISSLGFIRQYLGELPKDRTFTAGELWEVFEAFAPLMTEEQQKMLVESLKNAGKILDKVEEREIKKRL